MPALALALLLALLATTPAQASFRVVGGAPLAGDEQPWAVALVTHGKPVASGFFCGGTLVGPRTVVTAAHCVVGSRARQVDVIAGRRVLTDTTGGARLRTASIVVHPGYGAGGHDIAVLGLAADAPAPATALGLATAAEDQAATSRGATVRVAGWGLSDEQKGFRPNGLRGATIRVRWTRACESAYEKLFRPSGMVCAGDSRADACRGDSGGPVVGGPPEAPRLVGVVSFGGPVCASDRFPGVSTRVAAERDFLDAVLAGRDPADEPTGGRGPVRVQIAGIVCGLVRCSVDLRVTGDARRAAQILVRVRRDDGFDRTVRAARLTGRLWRARISLPIGQLRISAFAVGAGGAVTGRADRVTVSVS